MKLDFEEAEFQIVLFEDNDVITDSNQDGWEDGQESDGMT